MLSTWVVLSSSQEEATPTPQSASTTRLGGKRICPLYGLEDQVMAALTLTIMREARYLVVDNIIYSTLIIFQTLMVSGGSSGSNYQTLSSTELLPATAPAWVFTGELPSPRYWLRGANIDNKILMTGDYYEIY